MNERIRNYGALEDNDEPGREESGPRSPTMLERVAVWVNEGGAGGDAEGHPGAPAREDLYNLFTVPATLTQRPQNLYSYRGVVRNARIRLLL